MDFSKYEQYYDDWTPIVSEENAFAQFGVFREAVRLTKEKIEANKDQCDIIIEAIMAGYLTIQEDDNGELEIIQKIKRAAKDATVNELVYGEIKTVHKQAMKKDAQEYVRMSQLMGAACKTNGGSLIISKLKSYDSKVMEALAILFLSV